MGWTQIFIVTALAAATVKSQESCLAVDENPYLYFATKTSYGFVNSGRPAASTAIPGCRPEAIWVLVRHGAHLPEANEINELHELVDFHRNIIQNYRNGNYKNNNQRMCAADVANLEKWVWDPKLNFTFAGGSTSEGYMASQSVAQHFRQKYPELFTANAYDYIFKHGSDRLSEDSIKAFKDGLFRQSAGNINIPTEVNETLFKSYESCPAWIRDIRDSNATLMQYNLFKSRNEYRDMVTSVSRRLGFNYDIDPKFVDRMYDMCRYSKAWDVSKISDWCAAFTKEDLKQLEYAEDLKSYYRQGYGSALNQQVACPLITDMMRFFTDKVKDPDLPKQPKVSVQFLDDPLFLMTITALGAHRDAAPLTADFYDKEGVNNRKWTTSTMDPFNANVAAVLYRCNHPDPNHHFKVLFLENEYPMVLLECSVGLCDWNVMKRRYGEIADKCDTSYCNGGDSVVGRSVGFIIAITTFIVSIVGI